MRSMDLSFAVAAVAIAAAAVIEPETPPATARLEQLEERVDELEIELENLRFSCDCR